jgi:hypothetical protein
MTLVKGICERTRLIFCYLENFKIFRLYLVNLFLIMTVGVLTVLVIQNFGSARTISYNFFWIIS